MLCTKMYNENVWLYNKINKGKFQIRLKKLRRMFLYEVRRKHGGMKFNIEKLCYQKNGAKLLKAYSVIEFHILSYVSFYII